MSFNLWNRRYTGSKYKLSEWICQLINENCRGSSFCDIFAGTAVVGLQMLPFIKKLYINDFLYSNEIIYNAFFKSEPIDFVKVDKIKAEFNNINVKTIKPNYVSRNFGNKFFSNNDALKIGYIREEIEHMHNITQREKDVLIASLLYSIDKIANTVGHYDAYIKGKKIKDLFVYELINPIAYEEKEICISRKDANEFAKELKCDIVYIDPPYNSRQYSRFYHLLENIAQWKKPKLYGTACKPEPENMSEYCRNSATKAFNDLISSIKSKYIVVSYNNTYNSKSSSSRNKISLDDIKEILTQRGTVSIYEKPYRFFDAGKTNLADHKELVFITKVKSNAKKQ